MHRIELYYDIVSPYSYLAFVALCRYEKRWGLDLVLRPAFLGGILKATGNQPPMSLPARAPYLLKDLARLSSYFEVPLRLPEGFPVNTLPTMRFLTVASLEAPEALRPLSHALWQRLWERGEDISTEEGLVEAAQEAHLSEETARRMAARIGESEVKDQLRARTDEAVSRGAFGVPTFFFEQGGEEEMIFGQDRLPILAHLLGLRWDGPVPERERG